MIKFTLVCESQDGVCNVYGASPNCGPESEESCGSCKEGYFGARCEFCINDERFTIFEGVNGTVDPETGKGIWCGKYVLTCEKLERGSPICFNFDKYSSVIDFKYWISGKTSVLVAGGYNGKELRTVEVIGELEGDCKLPDLPFEISYVPSVVKHGINTLLCGGQQNEKSCLRLDERDWIHFNELSNERTCASAVSTNGTIHIFGGRESKTNSEILTVGNNKWKKGAYLKKGSYGSCGVRISDQELLIIGGSDTPYRITKFNFLNNTWSELPIKLTNGRKDHACQVFNSKVIISGGRHDGESMKSTEIIDLGNLSNLTLRHGGNMIRSRYRHGMGIITWKGKQMLIAFAGRLGHGGYWDSIEAWNDSTETWTLIPERELKLKEPKMAFGYATLPTELICPNRQK